MKQTQEVEWVILEIFGKRSLAGQITWHESKDGIPFLRLDIPEMQEKHITLPNGKRAFREFIPAVTKYISPATPMVLSIITKEDAIEIMDDLTSSEAYFEELPGGRIS